MVLQDLQNGDISKSQKRIATLVHRYNDDASVGALAKYFKQFQAV